MLQKKKNCGARGISDRWGCRRVQKNGPSDNFDNIVLSTSGNCNFNQKQNIYANFIPRRETLNNLSILAEKHKNNILKHFLVEL